MAIKRVNKDWCSEANAYRYEFVIDSTSDVSELPACCVGSTAIVADKDGPIYMVNASGEWKEV